MANNIEIIDGFTVYAPTPIDKRLSFETLSDLHGLNVNNRYWGLVSSVNSDLTSSNNTLWKLEKGHVDNDLSNNANFVKLQDSSGFSLGSTYTFSNGLTHSLGDVKLGGVLTQDTLFSGGYKISHTRSGSFADTGVYGISGISTLSSHGYLSPFNGQGYGIKGSIGITHTTSVISYAGSVLSGVYGTYEYSSNNQLSTGSISSGAFGGILSGSGNITNIRQMRLITPTSSYTGTITNYSMLYIETTPPSPTNIMNRYGIYQVGEDDYNVFNGSILLPNASSVTEASFDVMVLNYTDKRIELADSSLAHNGLTYTAGGDGFILGGALDQNTTLTEAFSITKSYTLDLTNETTPISFISSMVLDNTDEDHVITSSVITPFNSSLVLNMTESVLQGKLTALFANTTLSGSRDIMNEDGHVSSTYCRVTFDNGSSGDIMFMRNVIIETIDNGFTGNIDNYCQLYISAVPNTLNDKVDSLWGIYQAGNEPNYLKGVLSLGDQNVFASTDNVTTHKIEISIGATKYYILASTSDSET